MYCNTQSLRMATLLLSCVLLAACSALQQHSETTTVPVIPPVPAPVLPDLKAKDLLLPRKEAQLWDRIRENYKFTYNKRDPKILYYIKKYKRSAYLHEITKRGTASYLHLVVDALERRNLPGELALLPLIESAYNPRAYSDKGAAGLWQIMPYTARTFGLKRDHLYDGRMDIPASTEAALDFLEYLKSRFEDDWLLVLAAYNSGEGKVSRSIAQNKKIKKSTDFWALNLPKETKDYIPKLLALAEIIHHPEAHGIKLPIVYDEPSLIGVQLDTPLHFNKAAHFAGITVKELKHLNPGYPHLTYHPHRTSTLLMPIENVALFLEKAQKEFPSARIAGMHAKPVISTRSTIDFALRLKQFFAKE